MPTAGWKNPRWAEITDPIYRHIFDSLEKWTINPQVETISTPRSTVTATYNAVTDRVDQPPPVTLFGDQLVEGKIQSANFVAGSTGWVINSDGTAEFSNVTVRGELRAGTVASGPMAGLARFEAIAAHTVIRDGLFFLDNSAGIDAVTFRFANAGPTYTTTGRLLSLGGGIRLQAGGSTMSSSIVNHDGTSAVETHTNGIVLFHSAGDFARVSNNGGGGPILAFLAPTLSKAFIQHGTYNATSNASGNLAVTFPEVFPGSPQIHLTPFGTGAPSVIHTFHSESATGFTVHGDTSVNLAGHWMATFAN